MNYILCQMPTPFFQIANTSHFADMQITPAGGIPGFFRRGAEDRPAPSLLLNRYKTGENEWVLEDENPPLHSRW